MALNMYTTQCLSMEMADAIATASVNACKKNGFKPVAIAVLDPGGAVIVSKRMTGCAPGSYDRFAHAKAYTASSLQMSSRTFRDKCVASWCQCVSPSGCAQICF